MARSLRITRLTVQQYGYELPDMGYDYNGFNNVYQPGARSRAGGYIFTIETNEGITGEYAGGNSVSYAQIGMVAQYLLGKNPLTRERIYDDIKRALRKHDRFGLGPIDIALWDIAGKVHNAPIYELLGGFRQTLPAYASTYHGDENGGLDSPEAFAEFAAQCKEIGYLAFKIHGWGTGPIQREVATVLATRKAVGDDMDLMIDPACEYETFSDALRVGKACDEANFFWYEDPYKDGGQSAFAHRKLRELIKTPLLLGEHVRGLELKVDQIVAGGTDYVRADADYDGGITGVMKIAHMAEGFGLDCEIHAP
ncbi:MAG: enolase C-terminal domain-like protein, partial [Thermomicrobiales bacterium]